MSEGARNESGSTGVAPAGLLRDAVLGGPGAAVAGGLRAGVLGWLAGGEAVRAALASEGHVDARRRVLTGEVTVAAVLGLCLFSGEGYDSVLARVVPAVAPGAAVPTASALSQARMVTLACCGTRRLRAAALGSYATSEQELVEQLLPALTPGTLNLADRNFFSMARWIRAAETGAELAWRVKNGARSLPAKTTAVLPGGSSLLRLRESDSMLSRRRAEAGDRTLPRLPDTAARLVEFDVLITDEAGKTRRSRFRVLTTLTDHRAYPARQIAAVYAERWQVELAYYRIKVTLRGPGTVLRGQTPALARQEVWGLLVVYNALCDLATRAAVGLGVDPDEISFVAVLRRTRTQIDADTHRHGTRPGTDAVQALTVAIAAHPATEPVDNAPAPALRTNDVPNEPARSATRSTSSRQIYPKPHEDS